MLTRGPQSERSKKRKQSGVVDIDGKTFRLKQVSENGDVLDSFQIAK